MNLREILLDVDTIIPNQIMPETKVRWINQIQRELYREVPFPISIYPFITGCDKQLYNLPADCRPDTIETIVIGEITYDRTRLTENDTSSYFWEEVAGSILIHPTPQNELLGFIYYRGVPVDLSAKSLEDSPSFPDDYHQVLVDGCVSRVAKAEGDAQRAGIFESNYHDMIRKMKIDMSRNETYRVQMDYGWG